MAKRLFARASKVPSFCPLSPQRGERVRVRGIKKNPLATSIIAAFF
jgi:hypothetical protein